MARSLARDHDQKRASILKAAAEIFAREGVARASMAQVASACGISKANIYHYYASKNDLLFDILDSHLFALMSRLDALPLDQMDGPAKLRLLVAEILNAYEGMDAEHKIQSEAIGMLAHDRQDILRDYQRQIVAQMSSVLQEVSPEPFHDDPDKLKAAAMSVFGMLNWFYMWNGKAGKEARQAYAQIVTDLTLGGIKTL